MIFLKQLPSQHYQGLGIKAGECFGLLGPNGAGKTTTLAVLTGAQFGGWADRAPLGPYG